MIAAEVFNWTSWGNREIKSLAPESQELFDAIFIKLQRIETSRVNNYCELWLPAKRGTVADLDEDALEDFCEQYGEADSRGLEEAFISEFPEDVYWFKLESAYDLNFRHLRLGGFTITLVDGEDDEYPHQCTEILEWVNAALTDTMTQIADGSYYRRMERELPLPLRYGTVSRRDYWACCPDNKLNNLKDLTQDEIDRFISVVEEESTTGLPIERIQNVTFNQYFRYASHAFHAIGLNIKGKIPFEQFMRYGENFGGHILQELEHDSYEDFLRYYKGELRTGGHPWGLLRGTSRSRIMLWPEKDERGWYFCFGGNPNWSVYEIVKMYLALKKCGCPVCFPQSEQTVRYLREEDTIGIVPINRLCVYCQSAFPGLEVKDFRHFHADEDGALKDRIRWLPFEIYKLKE